VDTEEGGRKGDGNELNQGKSRIMERTEKMEVMEIVERVEIME
jgi:hypothetical protein